MKTTIEWTGTPAADGRMLAGYTWNPWWGCTRITEGCNNCYAEAFSRRLGDDLWGKGKPRRLATDDYWRKPLAWDARAAKLGVRLKVFCASMADIFDAEVPAEWRLRVWDVIGRTPHLDWLLLTKRPENWAAMVPWHPECGDEAAPVPHNVWLGATVENERRAGERLAAFAACPAAVRFLSLEPLLGPVDVRPYLGVADWLILGGESGNRSRPFDVAWVRDILAAARGHNARVAAGDADHPAACFVKQLGTSPAEDGGLLQLASWKGNDTAEWPADVLVREFPTPRLSPAGHGTLAFV